MLLTVALNSLIAIKFIANILTALFKLHVSVVRFDQLLGAVHTQMYDQNF